MDSAILYSLSGFALMIFIYLFIKFVSKSTNTKFTISQKWNPSNSFSIEPNINDELTKSNRNFEAFNVQMSIEHEILYVKNGDVNILNEYKVFSGQDRHSLEIYLTSYPDDRLISSAFDSQRMRWCIESSELYGKLFKRDFSNFKTISNEQKNNINIFLKHHDIIK